MSEQVADAQIVEIREQVENTWRKFLRFAAEGNTELGKQVILRADEIFVERANKLDEPGRSNYLAAVEAERNRLFDEYTNDPESLKRRLGVDSSASTPSREVRSTRQGIGEVAVKTAVRAGIWAAIWELFR